MKEIIKMFRKEFPYIDREEKTLNNILSNKNNHFIERRDEYDNLIAVYIINQNVILFFCIDEKFRNKGLGTELLKESENYRKLEEMKLSKDIDYNTIPNLALEARQKLNKIKPLTIGQATRISGVNPADISILLIHLKMKGRR